MYAVHHIVSALPSRVPLTQPTVAEQIDCTFNQMCPWEGERCIIWYLPFQTLFILLPSFALLFLL